MPLTRQYIHRERPKYLHLLRTAWSLEKGRAYHLIKLFGLTGLFAQELPEVTVVAVLSNIALLVEQAMERMMKHEQLSVGGET